MMFVLLAHLDRCLASQNVHALLATASQFQDKINDDPKWKEIHDAFAQKGTSNVPMHWIALILAIVVALFFINWLHQFFQRRTHARRHLVSFELLAADLGLGWSDRKLLIQIAQHQQLPSPLTLMLSDPTLVHHAKLYIEQLPSYRQHAAFDRTQRIRVRLFSQPQPPPPPPEASPSEETPIESPEISTAPPTPNEAPQLVALRQGPRS